MNPFWNKWKENFTKELTKRTATSQQEEANTPSYRRILHTDNNGKTYKCGQMI